MAKPKTENQLSKKPEELLCETSLVVHPSSDGVEIKMVEVGYPDSCWKGLKIRFGCRRIKPKETP